MTTDQPDVVPPQQTNGENLEEAFRDMFGSASSGGGEEELLKIASRYSLQLSAKQMKALLYIEMWIDYYETFSETKMKARQLKQFVTRYLELKQYNGSDLYLMKALEYVSLYKYIKEDAFKVMVDK